MSFDAPRDLEALIGFIESREPAGFNWNGKRDCVAFAGGAVEALSGCDPLGELKWESRRQALKLIEGEGGLESALDRRFARVPAALAKRGDIAGVDEAELGIRLMIVEGATLVGPGEEGNVRLPREEMVLAWDAMSFRSPEALDG